MKEAKMLKIFEKTTISGGDLLSVFFPQNFKCAGPGITCIMTC
jgi:hypothetical protein